ncbi:TetR family transcriptional regulator [Scopulibacillus darangshiensis]|uniref:TetR family transcriptional regulator n=1 Tax=Scopulibacillus darangshiensis TaxID=442528 RepID=A0A4R2P3E1_9BACL|nr:TetR/AcrR family transcriptional regulator [Scopulibacillus darangshiensis]TCP29260.1 TetR family transcriptional regulator [Scopulibacillus darangshiensis]
MSLDRKTSILKAAEESFALFGYKATTMDQVARIANVGKGTIYTFFKNKEELFDDIIEKLIHQAKDIATTAIRPEDSFFDNLHRALYGILAFRKEHQLTIKLSQEVREIGTLPAKNALTKLEDAILHFIEGHIKTAMNKGELKTCDPAMTAFIMLKLYVALVFEWEQRHQPLEKEEIAHLFDLYLVKGLMKR